MNPLKNQQKAETIDGIYIELETRLMQNIAKHLRDWKQPIDSDVWLMKKLAEIGKLNKENIRIIAKLSGLSATAAERMLNQVAEETLEDLEPGFKELAKRGYATDAVAVSKSKNVKQVMSNMKSQAKDKLNLTNTTMLHKAQKAFKHLATNIAEQSLDIMNRNAASMITGAEARQQVLEKAIKQFNKKGITGFVDKRGREWTPEAYINMVLRTTAGNVAHEVQDARQRDYGIKLIEISSHSGARPKCAVDQGKIYALDNTSGSTTDARGREVEYFPWSSTSYGEPDGILGINCTHSKYTFVAGVSIQRYFPTEDMEENSRLYKQTQVQRAMERDIRKQKRECMLYDELGDEEAFKKASVALKQKEKTLEKYVEQHDFLHRRKDREKVVGYSQSISAKANAANKAYTKAMETDTIPIKDTIIRKSVGAKFKNYKVVDKTTGIEYEFAPGTRIQNSEVFAGKGTRHSLHDGVAEGLTEQFGGTTSKWQHAKGKGVLIDPDTGEERKAEVHWFQEESVGKVKFKVKEWEDES